jgi:hypothetical protein
MLILRRFAHFKDLMDDYTPDDTFSEAGLATLFDILNEGDTPIEMDPIAIRCQFTEYANEAELEEGGYSISEAYRTAGGSFIVCD